MKYLGGRFTKKKLILATIIIIFMAPIFFLKKQNIFAGDIPVQITIEKYFSQVYKEGILFNTSIFESYEITKWEDPNVFKGHDGYYYMFFSGDRTYNFRKLWLFRSSTLDFVEGELIGPIIDSPTFEYETGRIRARNVIYDKANEQYIAIYDARGDSGNFGCALICDKKSFPYGWKEHPDNPLISMEWAACSWVIYKRDNIWHAFTNTNYFKHYISDRLGSNWQIDSFYSQNYLNILRGVLMTENGCIFVTECYDGVYFFINPIYFYEIDNKIILWQKTSRDEAWIHAETLEEYEQVANPTLFYENGMIYVYYQSYLDKEWKYCLRARIELLEFPNDDMTVEDWEQFWIWLKNQGHQYWSEYLEKMLEKWKSDNVN